MRDYESALSIHGQTDLTYIDSTYKPQSWHITTPNELYHYSINKSGLKSLRELAARKLIEQYKKWNRPLLNSAQWGSWKHVWKIISLEGFDSFKLFTFFAQVFGNEKDFRGHFLDNYETSYNKRDEYIKKYKISKRHRIEFSPGDLTPLITELKLLHTNNINHITVLNLSGTQLTEQISLDILSLKHLIALDVSGSSSEPMLSEGTLSMWRAALTEQWNSMRILCISGRVKSTSLGYLSLFKMKNLQYIEGPLIGQQQQPIEWAHGKDVDGISERFSSKYTLTQKLYFLKKHFKKPRDERLMIEVLCNKEERQFWVHHQNNRSRHCYMRIMNESVKSIKKRASSCSSAGSAPQQNSNIVKRSKFKKLTVNDLMI